MLFRADISLAVNSGSPPQGTTFSNVEQKGDYDSEGRAIMTRAELEKWFTIYVAKVYANTFHRGIKTTPLARYKEGILGSDSRPGNGKTRLMKHFLSLHQASESNTGTITAPVLYVQCPGFPDESRLYTAILLKLCKKFRPSAPAQEKLVLVLDALSKIEIRILALDEVNFTEVGTAAKQKRFLNALRYLANELRISIVCLGTEEMMRVIRSVPSVEDRFPPMVLPQWQPNHTFRQLLASFEKIIPLTYPSGLPKSSTLTAKLLARSEGTIGELKMLLAAAATDAMRKGTERITEEIIDGCNYTPPSARKQRSVSG